ncbi:unnamed protein product [Gongylonema pulchrum]|uniref:GRIP domain-containing protein n=1 Tax=Gongylonema pulchrum TaxID=637853 RepID=A0A183E4W7_9BILA|nr:unnamed protein product [Gongylonema pulchrum]
MLARENEMFVRKLDQMEKERQSMYWVALKKSRESAAQDIQQVTSYMDSVDKATEDRIVLQLLRDAFYHYLLNRGDSREHLQAIMAMLNFSQQQKEEVSGKRGCSH